VVTEDGIKEPNGMKSKLTLILKVAISAALLGIVCLKVDWGQFSMPKGIGRSYYLIYGVIGGIVFNLIKFLKWQNLLLGGIEHSSYWDAAKSYMIGNSLGLATPLRVGELGRALYFEKTDRPRILSLTVVDRLIELMVVMLLAVAGIFILVNKSAAIFVALLSFGGIFAMYGIGHFYPVLLKIAPAIERWDRLGKYLRMLGSVDSRKISVNLVLSFLAFVSVILQLYCLISAFETLNVTSAFLAGPLITISSIMPVSFMGLGVREGISVILFANFGISGAIAVAAAFLLFVINNLLVGAIGIVFVWRVL
jgi:uncharacterized membrane protein YbhN (UPF0104 family)